MEPTLIASFIGIVATTQIHISKGLQKYGIAALRLNSRAAHSSENHLRKKIIYVTGIILNNLAFMWVLVANLYAPTSYYTSVFGIGLVVLMVFSEVVLKEKHSSLQHIGAAVIAFGTMLIGFGSNTTDVPGMSQIQLDTVLIFIAVFYPLLLIAIGFSIKLHLSRPIGTLVGMLTGCSAALDPIFKGIGQTAGSQISLIPHTEVGWLFFMGSFIFGAMALFFTQLGFYQHAKASTLVAFHNISLILLPIILLKISLPGFRLARLQSAGLFVVVCGIALMFTETTLQMVFRKKTL